jgi:hypothetical protein
MLLAGIGTGPLFQTPLIGTRNNPHIIVHDTHPNYFSSAGGDAITGYGDLDVSNPDSFVDAKYSSLDSTTFGFLRQIGGTLGISIGGAIYGSGLRARLPHIEGYSPNSGFGMTDDVQRLIDIQVRDSMLCFELVLTAHIAGVRQG